MSNRRYSNDDLELTVEGVTYTVDVTAYGTYSYSPATRWEPEDSNFEIDEVDALWKDKDGNVVPTTEEMDNALISYLYGTDGWDEDRPEPIDDEYEERTLTRWKKQFNR